MRPLFSKQFHFSQEEALIPQSHFGWGVRKGEYWTEDYDIATMHYWVRMFMNSNVRGTQIDCISLYVCTKENIYLGVHYSSLLKNYREKRLTGTT